MANPYYYMGNSVPMGYYVPLWNGFGPVEPVTEPPPPPPLPDIKGSQALAQPLIAIDTQEAVLCSFSVSWFY